MIYLTAAGGLAQADRLAAAGIGVMLTPASGVRVALAARAGVWAADNGCFSQGERFDLDRYLGWLAAMAPAQGNCLFATAPDVMGDAAATWARSAPVLPRVRALGYAPALVAQDGWDAAAVEWDAFDVLFIGGTDGFKLCQGAHDLVRLGRARRKRVHVGRVNSWARLAAFALSGADSADGTTMAFNRHRYLPEVSRWGHRLRLQRTLWEVL